MNIGRGTFTPGPKYETWVNSFHKEKKALFGKIVCVNWHDTSLCQPAQVLPLTHQNIITEMPFSKFLLHKTDIGSRKDGGLFTFYSQKYKVVCQEHHFVQNCTDSSKLRQKNDRAVRSDKKINGRCERSVICETGLLKLSQNQLHANRT